MVYVGGKWGTVCKPSKEWHKAFCTELGYPDADKKESKKTYYGIGSGHIGFMKPECEKDVKLSDCWGVSKGSCDHSDDISVHCKN